MVTEFSGLDFDIFSTVKKLPLELLQHVVYQSKHNPIFTDSFVSVLLMYISSQKEIYLDIYLFTRRLFIYGYAAGP